MNWKENAWRYLMFVFGLYFLSAGVVLIVRSALGTTPISSVNYVMSLNSPLSLGVCTFLINMLLIVGQFWLIRERRSRQDTVEILLQIPFSFLFAAFIDLNMALTRGLVPANYAMSLLLLLVGCVVQAVGVVLEIKPRVAMMSAEAFVKYASQRYNMEFGKVKVRFDVTLVLMAVILSLIFTRYVEGVREGSVIAACMTGYIVSFLNNKIMTRRMLNRLLSIWR
ncbi:MAG TPA: hypothetical protein H9888_06900 [Candidatus Rikenella faecigallinarum]|uniref:YitT family protein n=1 Tax=Candidatus Rikenella faecigallinarum TaxID=2838745 RepID=A0A9D1QFE2_9BACT|nr:hypothetical protein [Candidatus Rikenella faecigallinarum]